jgi:hypothetical protein
MGKVGNLNARGILNIFHNGIGGQSV